MVVNVVLVGPNGVGKTTVTKSITNQAIIQGHTVLFTTAGQMLSAGRCQLAPCGGG